MIENLLGYLVQNILLVSGIIGFAVVVLSILLANTLPSKPPIGALIIVVIHWALLMGCLLIALMYWSFGTSSFFDTSSFYRELYNGYYTVRLVIAVSAIVYGTIIGLVAYAGARFLWRNNKGCSPLLIVIGGALMLLNCILMILGFISLTFATGMLQG